ncbi:MAG: DegT/DnrJ/EryC1/StrS family aminotransferase [Thaumarchaeota archaeon]|nr:DegT/DnrJ/EryC1/StrS family aminotransferase [Nitrososphaerota archaeon]
MSEKEYSRYKVPLAIPSYGEEEINEVISTLRSRKVTLGEKVKRFEDEWANYIGTKYALMVNSGSSANLLAHVILSNPSLPKHIEPGSEIITPAVTWATTVYPIINVGAKPVFVDVDLDTFTMKIDEAEKAISDKTSAVTFVHLLGNPCDMDRLMSFGRKNDLLLIEDACNAHGGEYDSKKCGSFGDIGTFSFYFSHIISTIEGGMITLDNEDYYELAKALRVFGWSRGLKEENNLSGQYPYIDKRFLFAYMGYNFRPTEIQGAFGIHQIRRLDGFVKIRQSNARYWLEELRKFEQFFILPKTTNRGNHVWHHFPLTIRPDAPFNRTEIIEFLDRKGIETRQISAGNITEQPVFKLMNARKVGDLPNARLIMRNSFEWANHQGIGESERVYVIDSIREFINGVK